MMEPARLAVTAVAVVCLAAGILVALVPPRRATGTEALVPPSDAQVTRRDPTAAHGWAGQRWRQIVGALAGGVLGFAATGWPAVAVLAAAGVWWLPAMLGPDRVGKTRQRRAEAIAGWADGLRDVLSAAAGLQQALLTTAGTAPADIRPHIQQLAARIRAGQPPEAALRRLAADLNDPAADLVAAALIQASQHQARQLGPLLGRLADTARAHAAAAQRVATARAASRTTLRIITGTVVGGFVLLLSADQEFLTPYQSGAGQLVLLAVGAMFSAGLAWIRRLGAAEEPPHTLNLHNHASTTIPAADPAAPAPAWTAKRAAGAGT
ncbi:type II secretion system F family protein [Actinocatenispora comari]|uniref:Type II secretion system protein n=1 Tax=Actinocatenispora comari TaxID=2807577 RepID=A0A8J4ELA6_9ACTN|nr:type II secretion system F family protein [Actinocatenispora comari]GIL29077.1 type II secretion system protein [Actinocatenispora comari]